VKTHLILFSVSRYNLIRNAIRFLASPLSSGRFEGCRI